MSVTTTQAKCSLRSVEWTVIDLARLDGRRSVLPAGRVERFARALFGFPPAPRLADSRLEALRRFAVRAWNANLIRTDDTRLLTEAGYATAHLFEILAHVARRRGFAPHVEQHTHSVWASKAACPRSVTSRPALPAPRHPSSRGQSPHRQEGIL